MPNWKTDLRERLKDCVKGKSRIKNPCGRLSHTVR